MHKSCLSLTLPQPHRLPTHTTTTLTSLVCTTVLYLRMSCLSVSLAVSSLLCCVCVHVLSLCHVQGLSVVRGMPVLWGLYLRNPCAGAGIACMVRVCRGKSCARGRNVPCATDVSLSDCTDRTSTSCSTTLLASRHYLTSPNHPTIDTVPSCFHINSTTDAACTICLTCTLGLYRGIRCVPRNLDRSI